MASAAAAAPAELAEAERGMSAENGATGSTGPSRQNASDQPSIAPPYVNDLLSTVLHSTLRPASVNPKDYAWGNPGPAQQSRLFQQLAQMQQFYTVSSAAAGQLQMPSFGFPGFFPPFGLPTCFPAWGAQFPGESQQARPLTARIPGRPAKRPIRAPLLPPGRTPWAQHIPAAMCCSSAVPAGAGCGPRRPE